jgi:hypothetical protein
MREWRLSSTSAHIPTALAPGKESERELGRSQNWHGLCGGGKIFALPGNQNLDGSGPLLCQLSHTHSMLHIGFGLYLTKALSARIYFVNSFALIGNEMLTCYSYTLEQTVQKNKLKSFFYLVF